MPRPAPDAAERRIQTALRERVMGHRRPVAAAVTTASPATPAADDWWFQLYGQQHDDDPGPIDQDDADDTQQAPGRRWWRAARPATEQPVDQEDTEQPEDGAEREAPAVAEREGQPAQSTVARNRRGRALLYSAAAGVFGYWGIGLRGPLLSALDTAAHAPVGTLAVELAAATAVAAWRLMRWCLPNSPVGRVAGAAAGAFAGPVAAPHLAALAARYGVDLGAASLVLTCAVLLAVLWAADRGTRQWWPPLAWACRIPVASAVLAVSLYGTH